MFCEEVDFSHLIPIALKHKTAKQLESSFLEGFYEVIWDSYPEPEIALCFLAERYFKKKQYEKGVATLEQLVNFEPNNPTHYYRLACLYSCLKNKEKAIQSLKSAINLGFHDKKQLSLDKALDFIREEDAFNSLLEELDELE